MNSFLEETGLDRVPDRVTPMPERQTMLDDTQIGEADRKWCRSVIGELNHFVRSTKWDIAHQVSRVSQRMKEPTLGTVAALKQIGGYLKGTYGLSLEGKRSVGADNLDICVDADHHGDRRVSTRSHSGVMILLNGTPVFCRSNKQPKTSPSPTEAEIYALSEGSRDARGVAWVLEEIGDGSNIHWPLQL